MKNHISWTRRIRKASSVKGFIFQRVGDKPVEIGSCDMSEVVREFIRLGHAAGISLQKKMTSYYTFHVSFVKSKNSVLLAFVFSIQSFPCLGILLWFTYQVTLRSVCFGLLEQEEACLYSGLGGITLPHGLYNLVDTRESFFLCWKRYQVGIMPSCNRKIKT